MMPLEFCIIVILLMCVLEGLLIYPFHALLRRDDKRAAIGRRSLIVGMALVPLCAIALICVKFAHIYELGTFIRIAK